ncbi:hypothetical protein [Planomicrobium sp. Y74]|uniref:hypothetical protein n=1 Tax=Planomicrobium sp. Y74 TaxID=2478977 RepID=UPI0013141027|nr:hypothetical protein [Planomicrobium sp. Y74]
MEDGGEVSVRAGKSKTVEWMAFRGAKCDEGRNERGRVGFYRWNSGGKRVLCLKRC